MRKESILAELVGDFISVTHVCLREEEERKKIIVSWCLDLIFIFFLEMSRDGKNKVG